MECTNNSFHTIFVRLGKWGWGGGGDEEGRRKEGLLTGSGQNLLTPQHNRACLCLVKCKHAQAQGRKPAVGR